MAVIVTVAPEPFITAGPFNTVHVYGALPAALIVVTCPLPQLNKVSLVRVVACCICNVNVSVVVPHTDVEIATITELTVAVAVTVLRYRLSHSR